VVDWSESGSSDVLDQRQAAGSTSLAEHGFNLAEPPFKAVLTKCSFLENACVPSELSPHRGYRVDNSVVPAHCVCDFAYGEGYEHTEDDHTNLAQQRPIAMELFRQIDAHAQSPEL
jgi:hypothetical protein